MANILPTESGSKLTYSYPSKIPVYSYEEVVEQTPCLSIQTNKVIKKQDNILYIDDSKFDITTMTIKELINLLTINGVTTSYIEYDNLLDLPAIFLNDMSNKESRQDKVLSNPVDLTNYKYFVSKGLISVSDNVSLMTCRNSLTSNKAIVEVVNNKVFIKESIHEYFTVYYYVHATNFIWNINYKHIVTNAKSFVSKHLETF